MPAAATDSRGPVSDAGATWRMRAVGFACAWLLRGLAATWRYEPEGDETWRDALARGEPIVIAAWHGRLLAAIPYFRSHAPMVMISESRDGELIARTVAAMGFQPVRGSSTRGGVRGLLELVRRARGRGQLIGHLVDGPRGPLGEIKPGLLLIGQRAGAGIWPTYVAARHKWRFRSWDRMELPWPFSRVRVRFDAPLHVDRDLDSDALEPLRAELEARMRAGHEALDRAVCAADHAPRPA